jgi:hypothetical protein
MATIKVSAIIASSLPMQRCGPARKRKVGKAVPSGRLLGGEPHRVKRVRVLPEGCVAVRQEGAHDDDRSGRNEKTSQLIILLRLAREHPYGRI